MKLSNKTLIIFFGVILAYTLVSFTEIRLKGELRELTKDNSIAEEVALSGLKYLVISEDLDEQVSISSAKSPRIKIKSKSGEILSKLKYELKGDTLFLNGFELGENEEHFHFNVFVPKNGFSGFQTTETNVTLSDIQQDSLAIDQTGGRVTLQDDIEFAQLNITEREEANFYVYSARIGTVSIDLDDSDLNLRSDVDRLQGVLANNARLFASSMNEVQLKKDKNSSIRILD